MGKLDGKVAVITGAAQLRHPAHHTDYLSA